MGAPLGAGATLVAAGAPPLLAATRTVSPLDVGALPYHSSPTSPRKVRRSPTRSPERPYAVRRVPLCFAHSAPSSGSTQHEVSVPSVNSKDNKADFLTKSFGPLDFFYLHRTVMNEKSQRY